MQARHAGWGVFVPHQMFHAFETAIAALIREAIAEEREACAQAAESCADRWGTSRDDAYNDGARAAAEAIRARQP